MRAIHLVLGLWSGSTWDARDSAQGRRSPSNFRIPQGGEELKRCIGPGCPSKGGEKQLRRGAGWELKGRAFGQKSSARRGEGGRGKRREAMEAKAGKEGEGENGACLHGPRVYLKSGSRSASGGVRLWTRGLRADEAADGRRQIGLHHGASPAVGGGGLRRWRWRWRGRGGDDKQPMSKRPGLGPEAGGPGRWARTRRARTREAAMMGSSVREAGEQQRATRRAVAIGGEGGRRMESRRLGHAPGEWQAEAEGGSRLPMTGRAMIVPRRRTCEAEVWGHWLGRQPSG